MFTAVYLIRAIDRRESQRARRVALADARSWSAGPACAARCRSPPRSRIPLTTDAGAPFPERDLIIFLAFAVILVTLVGQGLTLGPLINWLGVEDDGEEEREEDPLARRRVAEAALARLDELGEPDWVSARERRPCAAAARLPAAALRRARGRRRRELRGARGRLAAADVRAVRRPARGAARAAQPRRDQRRGAAQGRARPRPRGDLGSQN